jgi:hypothetical protein
MKVTPGTWSFSAAGKKADEPGRPANATVDVRIDIKRASEPPTHGRLRVALNFLAGHRLTGTTAQREAEFQATLQYMRQVMRTAGVELDFVFHDVSDLVSPIAPGTSIIVPWRVSAWRTP